MQTVLFALAGSAALLLFLWLIAPSSKQKNDNSPEARARRIGFLVGSRWHRRK